MKRYSARSAVLGEREREKINCWEAWKGREGGRGGEGGETDVFSHINMHEPTNQYHSINWHN